MEQSLMVRLLRIVSVTEATSYLALLVATVVKQTGGSETGVTVLGPIHGVLYLVFVGLVLGARHELDWSPVRTVAALIIGSLPFGGFWIDRNWLAPHGRTGTRTGPPPDATQVGRSAVM